MLYVATYDLRFLASGLYFLMSFYFVIFNESFNASCFEVLQNIEPAVLGGRQDLKDLRHHHSTSQLPHCEKEELFR